MSRLFLNKVSLMISTNDQVFVSAVHQFPCAIKKDEAPWYCVCCLWSLL